MNDPRYIDYSTDPETIEREAYQDVIYCPQCMCYYRNGSYVPAPLWADCVEGVCWECEKLNKEELYLYNVQFSGESKNNKNWQHITVNEPTERRYDTVKIGSQVWNDKDLNETKYKDLK